MSWKRTMTMPHSSLLSPRTCRSGRTRSRSANTINAISRITIGRIKSRIVVSFTNQVCHSLGARGTTGCQVCRHARTRVRRVAKPLVDSAALDRLAPDTLEAPRMTDDRERWALILGGSSGMGEATALALAKAGYNIAGIHLDFRAALAHVEEVKAAIEAEGVEALYINMNAADDEKRAAALVTLRERFDASEAAGRKPYVRVVMHSLAFGSLVPFLTDDPKGAVDRKKMEMTQDVMANSLVYWVQDLYRGGFLENGSKIYAMTSEGSSRVVPSYGVVSSAKAALESHIRQLAMELAQTRKGITANTIRAGVTMTPALMKIPEHDMIIESATKRNPTGRMTTPQDVAKAIVVLSGEGTDFINGEVIGVDGGEFITGS